MRHNAFILFLLLLPALAVANPRIDLSGHTKFDLNTRTYPSDSLIRSLLGASSSDPRGELRLNLEWRENAWTVDAAYQLLALHGDSLSLGNLLPPGADALLDGVPNDDRRLMNLTDVIDSSERNRLLHRLDRLWLGHATDKTVLRFGRQALSWGNGLFYAPMDLVNPFDPAVIDTEYKAGDDMLYAQYLRDNGEDVQGAVVFRRDRLSGDVDADQATVALKYHGFAGEYEYDLLIADNYDDAVFGIGGGRSIGGAVWRADIVVTDTNTDTYVQIVSNMSYSWVLAEKNMNGNIEYFFNGFGQSDERYAPASLVGNPDLLQQLTRNQLFTLGRHYLAASITVEMTPLWTVTPVLLSNLADPSGLLQLTTSYSLADNIGLLGSINIPLGPSGSEFGGIDAGIPGQYFSAGAGIFAQFAWYF